MSYSYEIDSNNRTFYSFRYIDLQLPIFNDIFQELLASISYCGDMPCIATGSLCPTYSTAQAPSITAETNCISCLLGCLIIFPISFAISIGSIFIIFALIILIVLINIIGLPCVYSYSCYIKNNVTNINTLPIATDLPIQQAPIAIGIPIEHTLITLGIPIELAPKHMKMESLYEPSFHIPTTMQEHIKIESQCELVQVYELV
jgi:hypothetical protein